MKKIDVKVGEVYWATFSKQRVRVQILREVEHKNTTIWEAQVIINGRKIHILSAHVLTNVN